MMGQTVLHHQIWVKLGDGGGVGQHLRQQDLNLCREVRADRAFALHVPMLGFKLLLGRRAVQHNESHPRCWALSWPMCLSPGVLREAAFPENSYTPPGKGGRDRPAGRYDRAVSDRSGHASAPRGLRIYAEYGSGRRRRCRRSSAQAQEESLAQNGSSLPY